MKLRDNAKLWEEAEELVLRQERNHVRTVDGILDAVERHLAETCPVCGGSGQFCPAEGTPEGCDYCGGSGRTFKPKLAATPPAAVPPRWEHKTTMGTWDECDDPENCTAREKRRLGGPIFSPTAKQDSVSPAAVPSEPPPLCQSFECEHIQTPHRVRPGCP